MLKLFSRILKLSGKYRGRIQWAFLFSFLKAVFNKMPIAMAFFVLSRFYDRSLTPGDCLIAGIALVAFVALESVSQLMSDRLQSAAGYMMFADKRIELGAHLRRMPMGYFTAGNMGKISSVLSTDMIFVEEIAMSTLANMMSYALSSVLMCGFALFLDIRLGAVTVLVSLAAVCIAGRMNRVSLEEAAGRQEQSEKLTEAVLAFSEGIGIIKSYNMLGEKSKELTENFRRSKGTSLRFEESMTPWMRGLNLLYAAGMTLIFALAVWLEQSGELSLPYMLGMLLFVFDIFGPLKALYGESAGLTVMNSCLDRIEEVFHEAELKDEGREHLAPKSLDTEIEFERVTFSYGEEDVLRDVSFRIKPDTMTALVGPSGGGKTTIASLLARFWDVKSGCVKVRGRDVREIPLSELMDHVSMVFQRVYLFRDTIYNNISMGKPDATREEVYEAAKKARCYDFIMELPDGFETVVGEGGATLSGGEKQRISIARCMLKDADIVILDEATASVDADNESYIQEAITRLVRGKTVLVIAHRLNTIRAADQILVVSGGRITQRGTHEELMKEDGIYKDFVRIRQESAGWSIT